MEVDTFMFSDSDGEEFLPEGLQSDISNISVSSSSSSVSSAQSSPRRALSTPSPNIISEVSSSSQPPTLWQGGLDFVDEIPENSNAATSVSAEDVAVAPGTSQGDDDVAKTMSSAFVSIPKDLMSDSEDRDAEETKKAKKKVRKKRKSDEGATKEGGKKKRKKKSNDGGIDGKVKEKKKKKNKPANKRRNIKKLLTEDKLTADTLAAQLQEEQRKQRLIELQKSREVAQSTTVTVPTPSASYLNALLDKQTERQVPEPVVHRQELQWKYKPTETIVVHRQESQARVTNNIPAPRSMIDSRMGGSAEPECIVLDTSSGSDEDRIKKQLTVKKQTDVIEILSSDDDVVVASESSDSEADDGDLDNSGQHTNDEMNQPDALGRVLVNINHPPKEDDIFLPPQLAKAVKPHQIGGIRFLYDNLVESLQRYKSSNGFGCILAHSMGLGKTLQVISFVDIFLRHTTAQHVLCIVPINTLQNWVAEFDMWLPMREDTSPEDGDNPPGGVQYREFSVHIINDNHKTTAARAKAIAEWQSTGGVLLMGYEMYRLLTLKKFTGSRRKKKNSDPKAQMVIDLEEEDKKAAMASAIMKALIQPGPDLVVCDEGHRIKNTHASISQTLKNIHTRRRVVLTGYPLQNNLLEYWCMVDFVRPNFLGTKAEFCNLFERPIMNGQCIDSTPKDVKMMQFRAHILHSLLEGFVQRRSHSVLHRTLPEKEEHVVLIRLTPIQNVLYHQFMHYFKESGSSGWCSTNPIKAFSVCCKIWNHPDVLYEAVQKKNEAESGDVDTDLDLPDMVSRSASPSVHRSASAPSLTALKSRESPARKGKYEQLPGLIGFQEKIQQVISLDWANDIFWNYKPNVLNNSGKMLTMFYILDESIRQGDKVLVFSQSLSTLDQIEKFLAEHPVARPPNAPESMPTQWTRNKSYFRLDGSSSSSEREKMINNFNSPTNSDVWLFLLSTRAGCLGVNLVGANRVIVFDASWNPCHDAQAVCRVYRYGQLKKCHIYRLVSENTLEKKIYDRQISKQGMSDRVIDELNPELNLTKKEVESLLEYDESDMPYEDFGHHAKKYKDPILREICSSYSRYIAKEPFTHESLLMDRKESRLTRAEKRAAKKSYEAEKRLNISYSRPSYTAYYPKGSNPTQTGSSSSINLSRFSSGQHGPVNRPVASVRPMQTTPIPMQPASSAATAGVSEQVKQRLLNLKQAGVTVQKIVTTTDIHLPGLNTPSTSSAPMIKAGETINIIRTQKGIYVRNQEGKIYAVRPGPSRNSSEPNASSSDATPPPSSAGVSDMWIGNVGLADGDKQQTPGIMSTGQSAESKVAASPPVAESTDLNPLRTLLGSDPETSKPATQLPDGSDMEKFTSQGDSVTNNTYVTTSPTTGTDTNLSTGTPTGMSLSSIVCMSTPTVTTTTVNASRPGSQQSASTENSAEKTGTDASVTKPQLLGPMPSVIPPFGALSLPSSSGAPLPLMSLAGLPAPIPHSQSLGYYPVPGMPPFQHHHSPFGLPDSRMNPMAGLAGLGYSSPMAFSAHGNGSQLAVSRHQGTGLGAPATLLPKAQSVDSSLAHLSGMMDASNSSSSGSSTPTGSSRFGEVGDLANLINFTQSNWLQNSMQRIGDSFVSKSDSGGEEAQSMDVVNDS